MDKNPLILFDGICNLCNSAVNFTIKRDKKGRIHFAALQSELAQKLLIQYQLPEDKMESFVFIENGRAYIRSTAALKVCRYLGKCWPACYAFMIVPKFIRDGIYKWIAKHRYKWFGMREQCMVPSPGIKARFIA